MAKKRRKSNKYMKAVTEPTAIFTGTLVGAKVTYDIAGKVPSSAANVGMKSIGTGFRTMPMVGTVRAAKGVMGALSELEKVTKKKRR